MIITDDPPKLPDEVELLARARAGETEAFCRVISPLQARLLRQAVALAGDVSTAEDLVSETLAEAWKSLPRYHQSCRFSTWLYSILLHRHWKSLRHARRRPVALAWLSFFEARDLHERQQNVPSPGPSPAEILTENEIVTRLRQHLERLPETHRQVVLLRFFEDASLAEIAVVLGCSVGTVKSRLHHALEKLRQMKLNLPGPDGDKRV